MGVLDQVTDMQKQGYSDRQITNSLAEQGIPPKQISEALNHARIKKAVSNQNIDMEQSTAPSNAEDELVPPTPSSSKTTYPKTKEISGQPRQDYQSYQPQSQTQEYYPSEHQSQGYAPQQGYYTPSTAQYQGQNYDYGTESQEYGPETDTDTMIEVAEQVFAEKLKPSLQKIDDIIEFKTLTESRVNNISDRLKRIESQIDKLQAAILDKVGSYGRDLEGVKKEMQMVEDSFGKVVGGLAKKRSRSVTVRKSKKTTTRKSK